MIGMTLNHSPESVESIKRWWKATGSAKYGGLEVPDLCGRYVPPENPLRPMPVPAFIPLGILPEGWEFLFGEGCLAPPGWVSSGIGSPTSQDGPCRHYRYWQPVTPSPENTAPYFDLYLVPLSWSGVSHSGTIRIEKGEVAFGPSANADEAPVAQEARLIGKSDHDLVFWYSDRLGSWETAPKDFAAYLKVKQ